MLQTSDLPLPFQNMSQSLQETINHQAKILKLNKHDVSFTSDELMKYIYVVTKGKVKNYQLNLNNGKEQTLYIYRQNHIFDTAILLDGCEHEVCYEVLEETLTDISLYTTSERLIAQDYTTPTKPNKEIADNDRTLDYDSIEKLKE